MNRVVISDAAHAAIMATGQVKAGEKIAAGKWEVEVSDETLARLEKHKFPGETVSETLVRILERQRTGGLN